MSLLNALRNFDKDRVDLDEMVALYSFGKGLRATYDENALVAPSWLGETLTVLDKEIKSRRRDNLEKALASAQGKLDSLKTAEEKRGDLRAEIEKIKAALA